MRVTWLLPHMHMVSSMYHQTGVVDHPFPGSSLGRHGKALSGYGILVNSTESGYLVWAGLQTNCHVDAPPPLLPSHPSGCSLKATATGRWRCPLAICTPLSSKGHIGIMTSDLPSWNTWGHLHQLLVWQLLQCRSQVVCLDGMNGGLEPLMFNFKELPLWNMANMSESS